MKDIRIFAFADEASSALDGQILALKRNCLDGLEIRGVDGKNISDVTLNEASEIRKRLDDENLTVFSVGSPIGKIGITDDFSPHLDKFKHTLELASVLGAENIRMFSFYVEGDEAGKYESEVLSRLGAMTDAAKGYSVTLCHENEKGIFGDIPSRCLKIHKAFPEIKAVFDPANFVQCGVDTLEAYGMLSDYIKYMHIKDSTKDGEIVPAGCGIGNIGEIASSLILKGVRSFTMEPHLTVFEGLSSLEKEGDKSNVGGMAFPDADTAFDFAVNEFKKIIGGINL